MGRLRKGYTTLNILSKGSKISKDRKCFSSNSLDELKFKKQKKIRENFRKILKRLMAKQDLNKENCLISFLNIINSCQQICSAAHVQFIPSIENMMSHHIIDSIKQPQQQQSRSQCSIDYPLQSTFLRSQPQIPKYFMCILERVYKMISCSLTKNQNQNLIKGTWNVLIKFIKDRNYGLFKVNEKVEWGLLELLNFKFPVGKKQLFEAEQRLRVSTRSIQIENQKDILESKYETNKKLEDCSQAHGKQKSG